MAMPPDIAYKQMIEQLHNAGIEISVSQVWRHSNMIEGSLPITTQYEVVKWEGKQREKIGNFHRKIDLYFFLVAKVKEYCK